jgi:hypothetical protein
MQAALGLIECRGLVAMIEAADAAMPMQPSGATVTPMRTRTQPSLRSASARQVFLDNPA